MTRFAAIDVGSNAMRCAVVEVDENGTRSVLENARAPVRLGSHVFLSGRIGEATTVRTVEAFQVFRRLIETHEVDHVRAIATSAVREAADGDEVLDRIRQETGIRVQTIDGAEEAHLVRRAVGSVLDLDRGRSAAVDVGGGSVEVMVIRQGDILRTESYNIGAVRLLEVLPGPADGKDDFYSLLSEYVDAVRERVHTAVGREPVDFVTATGGSVETLAELAGENTDEWPALDGPVRTIPLRRLRKWSLKLARRPFRERVERFGLREDRADVIVPASVLYLKIGEIFGVDRLYVPGVGLKDGLILDMVEELTRRGAIEARRREMHAAALGLGRRYALDESHATKVCELALSLFDQLGEVHGLGDEERTVLEAAALLHDIGIYISASKHHKHSYYLISQSDLVGLDRRQRELVAQVARYHRRRHPTTKHAPFASLGEEDRETVRRLAAILRVADVLDREHSQHVFSVKADVADRRLTLKVHADGDLLLEKWASTRKFELYQEVFDCAVELEEE